MNKQGHWIQLIMYYSNMESYWVLDFIDLIMVNEILLELKNNKIDILQKH